MQTKQYFEMMTACLTVTQNHVKEFLRCLMGFMFNIRTTSFNLIAVTPAAKDQTSKLCQYAQNFIIKNILLTAEQGKWVSKGN